MKNTVRHHFHFKYIIILFYGSGDWKKTEMTQQNESSNVITNNY